MNRIPKTTLPIRRTVDARRARIAAIARVAQAWLKPRSPWMSRAVREIPGTGRHSGAMVRACLATVFTNYTAPALEKWIQQDLGTVSPGTRWGHPPRILILSPSTVFAAVWQAATAVWLAGGWAVVKPSRHEPVFPRLLLASIRAVAADTLPMELLPPASRLPDLIRRDRRPFARVIAYGQDRTIAALRAHPALSGQVLGFDARIGVAVCGRHLSPRQVRRVIQRAAWDASLYDTQGCLSPQCFYIEEGGPISAFEFARRLGNAIHRLANRLPMRAAPSEDLDHETFWQRWRFRAAQGRARIFARQVILHSEPEFEPAGPRRVVMAVPIRRAPDLLRHLGAWRERLSVVAAEGWGPRDLGRLVHALRPQAIRVCRIGEMHAPPPSWHNCGINLLTRLHR